MTQYLIALAIGPVQDFIAAARRTRDLWFGSYVLSEVSKAAARALHANGATLIFPAPHNPVIDLQLDTSLNVANKLLAKADTADPHALVGKAKEAARTCWRELAQNVLEGLIKKYSQYGVQFHVRKEIWDAQVDDVLELFAAWVKVDGKEYSEARTRLDTVLAARKNTRDFKPSKVSELGYGLPKSSLDGLRETVLPEKELPKWLKRKIGLNPGEQLDCPGVVKRLGGDPDRVDQFTSISRITLDPWLRGIEGLGSDLKPLCDALEPLVSDGLVTRVKGNRNDQDKSIYASLPYDGQLLYPFRLKAARSSIEKESTEANLNQDKAGVLVRLDQLSKAMQPFLKCFGEPSPYVAVLHADGDRMGELLDAMKTAEQHQQVSQALAAFAQRVSEIVRGYRGHCIYSGGDDVLALMPLARVIACARALHDAFAEALRALSGQVGKETPTLSVGIAIGHLLEPRGRLLDLARAAEKLAKGVKFKDKAQQRDGVALILEPHSGATIEVRDRWDNKPDERFAKWVDVHLNDLLPDKAVYDLREAARELAWAQKGHAHLIECETRRILSRKQAARGKEQVTKDLRNKLADEAKRLGLATLANELLIARRLAEAAAQAQGRLAKT
jgi:CRISPR-associated protein Cmr2